MSFKEISHKIFEFVGVISTAALFDACGQIKLGPLPTPNDPVPRGTIAAQASFTSVNGQTVTGNAIIYFDSDTSINTLRLSGISAPNETGLQIIVVTDTTTLSPLALRALTGTQNYVLSLTGSKQWKQVNIHSTQRNQNYGEALLRQ